MFWKTIDVGRNTENDSVHSVTEEVDPVESYISAVNNRHISDSWKADVLLQSSTIH